MYVQRPVSPSTGYRPEGLMERRIAGLGQVPRQAPVSSRVGTQNPPVIHGHPDTPAYEFGGGWPTPFNDWRDWQGVLTPLAQVDWYYYGPRRIPISKRGRAGGEIKEQQAKFMTARNGPFFAAEMQLRTTTPGEHMPLWPNRTASLMPGNGPAPMFRVIQSTKDDRRTKARWPHVLAVQAGDQVLVDNHFLKDRQRVMPSGRYIQARERRYPRDVIPNPHMYDPNAVQYERGIKPGLEDPTPGETWTAVSGLQLGNLGGALGDAEPPKKETPWLAVMALLSVPGALLAWKELAKGRTRANPRRGNRRRRRYLRRAR